jgi:hypothetical protein
MFDKKTVIVKLKSPDGKKSRIFFIDGKNSSAATRAEYNFFVNAHGDWSETRYTV